MKTTLTLLLMTIFTYWGEATAQQSPLDITGFWKTINERTQKQESIVAIYKYEGEYFGRIMVTFKEDGAIQDHLYEPKKKAEGIPGYPYYVGMDIIWNLKSEGEKFKKGNILDPEKGIVYDVEAWKKGDQLVIRGKLFGIGRNQIWPPASPSDFPPGFKKPDLSTLVPIIPKIK